MPAPTPAPHASLAFRVNELLATSHRGEYRLAVRPDWAYGYFYPFAGGCEMLPDAFGKHAAQRAEAACNAHAAAQPVWPPMLGWPADGDLDAALALEALS